jgi:hypothetical protein
MGFVVRGLVTKEAQGLKWSSLRVRENVKRCAPPCLNMSCHPQSTWYQALRPLVAAAGLDPDQGGQRTPSGEVEAEAARSGLHSGAVLYALTDPGCAAKASRALVVFLANSIVAARWLVLSAHLLASSE